jgi:segregation and condensation protein B
MAKCLDTSRDEVELALLGLAADLEGRGIRLQRKGDDLQLVTAPENAVYAERFLGLQLAGRLSGAAMEALAVIAYRQPVTRAQVEAIRGVNSDGVLNTLAARGLIAEVGRLETAGRPVLFGTTFEFLQHFGLGDLSALPSLDTPSRQTGGAPPVAGGKPARLT